MIQNEPIYINGDGETSRDFCFVNNAVQANLLAATVQRPEAITQVYNVAVGDRTTLNELFSLIRDNLAVYDISTNIKPVYRDFRTGDVRHSMADIGKAQSLLDYAPAYGITQGLSLAMPWYIAQSKVQNVL